jgi:hypothetical protein
VSHDKLAGKLCDMWSMKRAVVIALAKADHGFDEVLYRPAVVKAFSWLPRWWQCDLAKASIRLDDLWSTGYWTDGDFYPGGPCEACGRRAAVVVFGQRLDPDDEPVGDYVEAHPLHVCAWCRVPAQLSTQADRERALAVARSDSVAWRWRVRP